MKAALVTAPSKIEIRDVPKPEILTPDDILIKVETASICNTTDYKIYCALDPKSVWPNLPRPYILGHECSGKVVDMGDKVTVFNKGDTIVLWSIPGGAFAEYLRISIAETVVGKISGNTQKHSATLMEMVICSARMLYNADGSPVIKPGDRVVVYGLGPSGLVYINLAKLMGAGTIIAVGRRKIRLEKASSMGADMVIDASGQNPAEIVKQSIGKPDVIIDATGSDILDQILGLANSGMTLIPYGVPPFNWMDKQSLLTKEGVRFYDGGLDGAKTALKPCIEWFERGLLHLDSLITHIIPLEQVDYGLKLCHEFRDETLKVVLDI